MSNNKRLTARRYEALLQEARARHDARFTTDNPPPELRTDAPEPAKTGVERAVQRLYLVWAILALAGAAISAPHTINALLGVVDLPAPWSWLYAAAGFVGVELALLGLGVVSALVTANQDQDGKQASVIGAVNALALRVGISAPFDTAHLPDRKPAAGGALVAALFVAALVFNLGDALKGAPFLSQYSAQMALAAKLAAGLLGPGLLLIAGHRFAHEVVNASAGRENAEHAHQHALAAWESSLNESWAHEGQQWIDQIKHERGYTSDQETAGPLPGTPATVGAGNGNGHLSRASN